jgi:hypothetical protein
LEQAFPADYRGIVDDVTKIVQTTSDPKIAADKAMNAMAAVRRKYAKSIALGSDADLEALLGTEIAIFQHVLTASGPELCAKVIVVGPQVLIGTPNVDTYKADFSHQMTALFHAARSGLDAPVTRRDPLNADWRSLLDTMVANGAPAAYPHIIAHDDPTDPTLCPAMINFFTTINTTPTDGARAVRAYLLGGTASL